MAGNVINYELARRISRGTFERWTRRMRPEAGDLLLAREAPVGPVAKIPKSLNVAPGQRTVLLRPNPDFADSDYLYYKLVSPQVQVLLREKSAGSTVAHLNVSDVRSLRLHLPPLKEQRAIAEVLGALDDKIAANSQLVKTTAAYLDAEFKLGSRGGRMERLADVAEFHNRRRVPLSSRERETRNGDIPYYGASGRFGSVDEALFDERLVLVGEDGSVVTDDGSPVVQYIWGPSWVNNHAHVLTGTSITTELLFLTLRRTDVRPLVTGAVQPKLSMGSLKKLRLTLPKDPYLAQIEEKTADCMALHRTLSEESQRLATTRDTLLPHLISGRWRVKDAEAVVEEVL